jgi:hypothetical protein
MSSNILKLPIHSQSGPAIALDSLYSSGNDNEQVIGLSQTYYARSCLAIACDESLHGNPPLNAVMKRTKLTMTACVCATVLVRLGCLESRYL